MQVGRLLLVHRLSLLVMLASPATNGPQTPLWTLQSPGVVALWSFHPCRTCLVEKRTQPSPLSLSSTSDTKRMEGVWVNNPPNSAANCRRDMRANFVLASLPHKGRTANARVRIVSRLWANL